MARTIIGQLIVNLVDNVSGQAKKVTGSLKEIENTARNVGKGSGKGLDDLASSLKRAELAARALAAGGKGVEDWGARFQDQITRLRASASEIDKVRESWRRLQDGFKGGRFDDAFRTNTVKRWQSETIAALIAVRREAERTNKVLPAVGGFARKAAIVAGVGSGIYGAGHVIRRGGRKAARDITDFTSEQARAELAGMNPAEQVAAWAKARLLSQQFPSVGQTGIFEHIRQLRARFGHFGHALERVDDVVKAQVMLQNLAPGGNAAQDLERLVLGLESMGAGADPEKFRTYLQAFVKAKSLFPDLRGEDFRQYLQTSKASKYGLSEDYLRSVVPTMMQHEGAGKFGTMQATAFGALVGLRSRSRSVQQMVDYGIADQWHKNSRGQLQLDRIKGEEQLISNPYLWAKTVLEPALGAKGVTIEKSKEAFVSAVTKMFGDRNAAEFFTSLLVNKGVIEKDRAMLESAKGIEWAEILRTKDLAVAAEAVKQQMTNVVQNALEHHAERAAKALNTVTDALAKLANVIHDDKSVGENALPTGLLAGGAATSLVGALIGGWSPLTGGLLRLAGGAGMLIGGFLATENARRQLLENDRKRRGATGKYGQAPFGDYTFGSDGGFAQRPVVPPTQGFMRNRDPMNFQPASGRLLNLTDALREEGDKAVAIGQGIRERLQTIFSAPIRQKIDLVAPAVSPADLGAAPSAPGRASGGSVYAGALYKVGEQGEEWFVPRVDGAIVPNRAGNAAGTVRPSVSVSNTFNCTVTVQVAENAGDLAGKIRSYLEAEFRSAMHGLFADYGVEVA